jgi:hypothetical protein
MDAFPARTMRMTPQAFLKAPKGAPLQRQGAGVPWTQSLLNKIHEKPMLKMTIQEVLGSNIPLVAVTSTPDEAMDQGFYQAVETLNAFALAVGINWCMKKFVEKLSTTWAKGLSEDGVKILTQDQKMWRNFALSAPLFAYLAGMEFFTPLLRNIITLKRTQEVEFSKITSLNHKKSKVTSKQSKEDEKQRLHSNQHQTLVKQRMAEYIALSKRDFAIMLPTAFALFGVGLMGMKHHWKMPKLYLDTPKLLEVVLGKKHAQEAGVKQFLRQGVDQFMNNLFYTDKQPQKYFDQKGKLDLVEEFLLPDGDWTQANRLLVALVFALPTYTALTLYSRDDVEKAEIAVRAVAYALANVLFPNTVENWVSKHIKPDAHIPYVGGKKNIELLAGTLAGSALCALLPMMMIRLTRPWRAQRAEEKQARQAKHAVVS